MRQWAKRGRGVSRTWNSPATAPPHLSKEKLWWEGRVRVECLWIGKHFMGTAKRDGGEREIECLYTLAVWHLELQIDCIPPPSLSIRWIVSPRSWNNFCSDSWYKSKKTLMGSTSERRMSTNWKALYGYAKKGWGRERNRMSLYSRCLTSGTANWLYSLPPPCPFGELSCIPSLKTISVQI